ncbi:hypothetical protein HDA32_001419 [Spinactinospora alkalitolerans]|uniref:Uncharacterized protein n=1 Tax=Spinactinospora alkalitolerans TaxID=687207 RepID=A0A852TQP7_9ACTN|nr:MerR [Spinactinospora alkalitolerans]NYE46299.1 hypothetical protein [Spinactinospora alkalitolerans]
MDRPVYRVTVRQEDKRWVAVTDGIAGGVVESRRLDRIEDELRDGLALLLDKDFDSFDLEWDYRLPPRMARAVEEFERARREREAAEEHYRQAAQEAVEALDGLSARDAGILLHLSNQRITQLRSDR